MNGTAPRRPVGRVARAACAVVLGLEALCSVAMPVAAQDFPVAMRRTAWVDATRTAWTTASPRPLATTLWYPADAGAVQTDVVIPRQRPIFLGGRVARDATLRKGAERLPLVVLSHGTGGSAFQMMWLGRALAARGYVVAAVDHHGNSAAEDNPDPRGFRLWWERAADVSRVIDAALADAAIGARIDPQRISAVGFSLGGATVIALAGGRIDLPQFQTFCAGPDRDPTCDPQREFPDIEREFARVASGDPRVSSSIASHGNDFRDARIRSFVAIAPAVGQAFTATSLGSIDAPVLVIGAGRDVVAPIATNARVLADMIPGARLETIGEAGHYSFLNTCTERGIRHVPICAEPLGIDRQRVHAEAIDVVVRFIGPSGQT